MAVAQGLKASRATAMKHGKAHAKVLVNYINVTQNSTTMFETGLIQWLQP